MLGDIDKAMKTIHNFHQVWKQFGFLPEFYNIVKNEAHSGREGYPLRPGEAQAFFSLHSLYSSVILLCKRLGPICIRVMASLLYALGFSVDIMTGLSMSGYCD